MNARIILAPGDFLANPNIYEKLREKVARVNEMITLEKMLSSLSANSLQL